MNLQGREPRWRQRKGRNHDASGQLDGNKAVVKALQWSCNQWSTLSFFCLSKYTTVTFAQIKCAHPLCSYYNHYGPYIVSLIAFSKEKVINCLGALANDIHTLSEQFIRTAYQPDNLPGSSLAGQWGAGSRLQQCEEEK